MSLKANILEFQGFVLDPAERVLTRDGKPVSLPPKAIDMLLVLVERPGQILEKEHLLDRVWPNTFVEEGNLTYTVRLLRKAFGDDAENPVFIETVPRRGYRFIAEIRPRDPAHALRIAAASTAHSFSTGSVSQPALAVAPESKREPSVDDHQSRRPVLAFRISDAREVPVNQPSSTWGRLNWRRAVAIALVVFLTGGLVASYYLLKSTTAGAGKTSIVVLPFVNESGNSEIEYLSDGITESLINSLAEFKQLRVVARGTAFRYKNEQRDAGDIGKELSVDAVLTGKVTQIEGTVIVQAELTDVLDGSQLWGERQSRKLADLPAIPESIARAIVNRLQPQLESEIKREFAGRFSHSSEAYQLDMKGRFFWNRRTEEGLHRGIGYFEQAIAEDPTYSLAYVGLADSYNIMGFYCFLPPVDAFPRARLAANKALELNPDLAEAHTSLAYVSLYYDWDLDAAERSFVKAIELKPNYSIGHQWYGNLLTAKGRWDDALQAFKRAREIDPLSQVITAVPAWTYYYSRQYDKAVDPCRKAIELDPNFALAHTWLGQAYERKGDRAQAISEFQESLRISKGSPEVRALLAHAYAVSGDRERARSILNELLETQGRYIPPYQIATIYIGLGEKEAAFEWLEKAYRDRQHVLVFLDLDPRMDDLRPDPRFQGLVRRIQPH